MEFSATAISRARMVEIGTVHRHRSTVFCRQIRNLRYLMTLTKLPRPNSKLAPLAAFRPLYPSSRDMRTVLMMGQTVKIRSSTIAGERYSHAFH